MQKAFLAVGALALFGMVQPASAQMCGGGQQPQTQASGGMMSGGMCGMMGKQADDPMAEKPAQKPQQQSGMCACCGKMAMGGMMQQHHGTEPSKQQ